MIYDAYDGAEACPLLPDVEPVYAEVYAEPPYLEGPSDVADFVAGWPRRCSYPGFRLVVARDQDTPEGFTFGHPLPDGTGWWSGLLDPAGDGVTAEWPGRTFAIIELAVRATARRSGVARDLVAHLLEGRTEERVTLLVRPEAEAEPARAAYRSWGYEVVGQLRPYEGAPVYDAMLLTRTHRSSA